MNAQLTSIPEYMLRLGLSALAHANWLSNYYSFENDQWSELSVLQATHAAEILLKARIAEEHPLLIFEQLPRPMEADSDSLELQHLFEKGRTVQYSDLPERLLATTGVHLPDVDAFHDFAKLRDTIQHFAPPNNRDCSQETIEFIFKVIDPFINECWGLFAVDYNEDQEPYIYFVQGLVRRGIYFLVSPDVVSNLEQIDLFWPNGKPEYQKEMERRFVAAQQTSNDAD